MNFSEIIRTIPDFPEQGVLFRDITTVLQKPEYLTAAIDSVAETLCGIDFELIIGPESRGFIFGVPLAYKLNKGFIPVRKAGKLPYKTISRTYDLEYGSATLEIHTDAIKPGQKVVVVDDLLATGGTCKALCDLIEQAGGEISALAFFIELGALGGREVLKGYNIKTVVKY